MSGVIPSSIAHIPKLTYLYVFLYSFVMVTIFKLGFHTVIRLFMPQSLSYFRYLDHNLFSGRIPDAFYKHPYLKEM